MAHVIKPMKMFKELYQMDVPLSRNGRVMLVDSRHQSRRSQYVCREIPTHFSPLPFFNEEELLNYFTNLARLEHPHLCRFVEAFSDENEWRLIYEKGRRPLFHLVQAQSSFDENSAANFIRQVAMGLSLAHSQNIVHGKLVPNSLVLDNRSTDYTCLSDLQIKVCDMGHGLIFSPSAFESGKESHCGYIAPEVVCGEFSLKQRPKHKVVAPKGAKKLDVWALGAIAYHMLTGQAPFTAENLRMPGMKITTVHFPPEMWNKLTHEAQDAVEKMLTVDDTKRIAASELLRHPWMRVIDERIPDMMEAVPRLLDNMRHNLSETPFRKLVLRVIAELLPKSTLEIVEIERVFRRLDVDSDGVLTLPEICSEFQKYTKQEHDNDQLKNLFAQMDRNQSGSVSVEELISAALCTAGSAKLEHLWDAFNAFDKNKDGAVSESEIEEVIRRLEGGLCGQEHVDRLCREILQEVDATMGSNFNFDRFVCFMRVGQYLPPCIARLTSWCTDGRNAHFIQYTKRAHWDLVDDRSFQTVAPVCAYRKSFRALQSPRSPPSSKSTSRRGSCNSSNRATRRQSEPSPLSEPGRTPATERPESLTHARRRLSEFPSPLPAVRGRRQSEPTPEHSKCAEKFLT